METNKNILSKKLETLRKNAGLTQKDVADILKIDRTTYTKYETGVTEPNVSYLRKLSEIFGVDLNYLLSDSDDSETLSDSVKDNQKASELLQLFNLLSEQDQEKLLSQLRKRTENSK